MWMKRKTVQRSEIVGARRTHTKEGARKIEYNSLSKERVVFRFDFTVSSFPTSPRPLLLLTSLLRRRRTSPPNKSEAAARSLLLPRLLSSSARTRDVLLPAVVLGVRGAMVDEEEWRSSEGRVGKGCMRNVGVNGAGSGVKEWRGECKKEWNSRGDGMVGGGDEREGCARGGMRMRRDAGGAARGGAPVDVGNGAGRRLGEEEKDERERRARGGRMRRGGVEDVGCGMEHGRRTGADGVETWRSGGIADGTDGWNEKREAGAVGATADGSGDGREKRRTGARGQDTWLEGKRARTEGRTWRGGTDGTEGATDWKGRAATCGEGKMQVGPGRLRMGRGREEEGAPLRAGPASLEGSVKEKQRWCGVRSRYKRLRTARYGGSGRQPEGDLHVDARREHGAVDGEGQQEQLRER
ncbi:hypothetical protein DFH09DRAFT_1076357 [Mycena vulgaris]|nr:hypothetical protein DFH09DRAFT_1076357 [Mycena vulgaris]